MWGSCEGRALKDVLVLVCGILFGVMTLELSVLLGVLDVVACIQADRYGSGRYFKRAILKVAWCGAV